MGLNRQLALGHAVGPCKFDPANDVVVSNGVLTGGGTRRGLLKSLRRVAGGDDEWDLQRKTRLVEELEKLRKLAPGRQVKLMVPAGVRDHKLADLPAGIHLEAETLQLTSTAPRICSARCSISPRPSSTTTSGFEKVGEGR